MQQTNVETLDLNAFTKLRQQWALVTAGTPTAFNMMTVSWGGFGVLWGKDVCTIYIRQSRHTKTFLDAQDTFTLTFLEEGHQEALRLCGAKSGREMDKMTQSGLTPVEVEGNMTFAEAELTLICRKLYHAPMKPEDFVYQKTLDDWYKDADYHTMYVGEIVHCLQKIQK